VSHFSGNVVVLTGGIGGAKLVLGLSKLLKPEQLTAIVNTGDDFEHLGLPVSPDLDTLMYTLADRVNPETGWGLAHETWSFMEALEQLDGETWFRLGDRDLATHITRAQLLANGQTLTAVTQQLCQRLAVNVRLLPMSDMPVRTRVQTEQGLLDFQHYFVRDRAEPRVNKIIYDGAQAAVLNSATMAALTDKDLGAIIIAPSNPYLSIDPLLSIPHLRHALTKADAPIIAISPIINGAAIKGPTAKIMNELGVEPSAASIARHYGDLLNGFIVDQADRDLVSEIQATGITTIACNTLMANLDDKIGLAQHTIEFAQSLS